MKKKELHYGKEKDNTIDVYEPDQIKSDNIIVLVHGGYWREKFTKELMVPLVNFFGNEGYRVANIEYRRGQESSWPTPLTDVTEAITLLKNEYPTNKIALIGHSVGGQLVLLNEGLAHQVVALAPVTDVIYTRDLALENNAVDEYFGKGASTELLKEASPISKGALSCPDILIVHGADDTHVKIETTLSYFKENNDRKHTIDLWVPASLSHIDCIVPEKEHMKYVSEWLLKK